eukprot:scaffold232803_cov21-Tisochrysis_lutea.AAC.1
MARSHRTVISQEACGLPAGWGHLCKRHNIKWRTFLVLMLLLLEEAMALQQDMKPPCRCAGQVLKSRRSVQASEWGTGEFENNKLGSTIALGPNKFPNLAGQGAARTCVGAARYADIRCCYGTRVV